MSPIYAEPFSIQVKNEKRLLTEIPPAIVKQSGIDPGEPLKVSVEQNGDIVFRRLENKGAARPEWHKHRRASLTNLGQQRSSAGERESHGS